MGHQIHLQARTTPCIGKEIKGSVMLTKKTLAERLTLVVPLTLL